MSTHELHLNHPVMHDHMWALEILFWILVVLLLGHVFRAYMAMTPMTDEVRQPAAVETEEVGDFWSPAERARMLGEETPVTQG